MATCFMLQKRKSEMPAETAEEVVEEPQITHEENDWGRCLPRGHDRLATFCFVEIHILVMNKNINFFVY